MVNRPNINRGSYLYVLRSGLCKSFRKGEEHDRIAIQAESTIARLQSGPLARHLPAIAEALQKEQYPPETVRRYVRVADKFGRWLCRHGLSLVQEADETILARYRARIPAGRKRPASRRRARVCQRCSGCFAGNMPAASRPVLPTPEGKNWYRLRLPSSARCGIDAGHTFPIFASRNIVREGGVRYGAVRRYEGDGAGDLRFRPRAGGQLKPSACAAPATSMRVFLRFLVGYHGLPAGVIGAVPTIRQWKWRLRPSTCRRKKSTVRWQPAASSRRLANGIMLSCCYSSGSRFGPGKSAASVSPTSIGEKERLESTLRNPHGNGSCPCPVTSVKLLQNTCRTAGPRARRLSSFSAPVHRFSPITGRSTVSGIAKRHLRPLGSRSAG